MFGNKYLVGATLLLAASSAFGQRAPPCTNETVCDLPNCLCSASTIPGGLDPSDPAEKIPQLVFLSFDAAVNEDNFAFYSELFAGRTNPNDQPITATFFVSHDYTVYSHVHELWRKGHEIGLHSISANSSQQYWQDLDADGWRREFLDQREQLQTFARVQSGEIKGVRAPQLLLGGDVMYDVLQTARFQYDASRPTLNFRLQGLWPYTNDFESIQECQLEAARCPVNVHAGFWSVPIISWISGEDRTACSLADQCVPVPETIDDTYNLLLDNFNTHYLTHRSPFGIFTRHGWVNGTGDTGNDHIWERREGYLKFLDYLADLDDVYIVSISRGLEWVKAPVPLVNATDFPAFQVTERPTQCPTTFSCHFVEGQTPFKPPLATDRWFHSCVPCPTAYPWVNNHLGRDPYTF